MNSTRCHKDDIALFSADGLHWFDALAPNQQRLIDWTANDLVTKIVIGTLDEVDGKPKMVGATIPNDIATLFPYLTHLHLWNIDNLEALPPLPAGLQCLDLRGCLSRAARKSSGACRRGRTAFTRTAGGAQLRNATEQRN